MVSIESLGVARDSALLRGMPDDLLAQVLSGAVLRRVSAGETIFLQGEPSQAVFLIVEGWVKLYRMSSSGAEALVAMLTDGSSFAEAVVLTDVPYPVSAEAISDGRLVQLDGPRLRQALLRDPELALSLLAASYVHLERMVTQIEQLKARSGIQRLAEFLVALAKRDEDGCRVELPYNKTLVAGHLGMQPESLSRAFARLRDYGVMVDANGAVLSDMAALHELANHEKRNAWAG